MQMWGFAVYTLLCSLFVADLIVRMEELELHYRRRGRYNFPKSKSQSPDLPLPHGLAPSETMV